MSIMRSMGCQNQALDITDLLTIDDHNHEEIELNAN